MNAALRTSYSLQFFALAVLFVVLTNVIYIQLWFRAPDDHRYTGIGMEAVGDKFVYYSMVEQGRRGALFMKNMHTSERQRGALFSPHWYLTGQVARMLHVSAAASYHFFRVILTLFFLWLMYVFVRRLFVNPRDQVFAYAAALFSAGLGWFYLQIHPAIATNEVHWMFDFQRTPADIYVTEMNPFAAFVQSPLFMLSYIMLVAIFYLFVACRSNRSWLCDALLAGLALFLVLIHPYDALVVLAIMGSWTVWYLRQTRSWLVLRRLVSIVLGVFLASLYHIWILIQEPALAGWLEQNITISPRVSMYVWALGAVVILWFVGLYALYRSKERSPWWMLCIAWSVMTWILIYLPLTTNRRFTNAWFIPLTLIAFYGVRYVYFALRSFIARVAIINVVAILVFSGTIWRTVTYATYQPQLPEKYSNYHDSYLQHFLNFVTHTVEEESVVLSNEVFFSMLVGAYAPVRLYTGHGHQTVEYLLKQQKADWFVGPATTVHAVTRKQQFLYDEGIDYVIIYRPSVRHDIEWMDRVPFLAVIFTSDLARMYKVVEL